MLRTAHHAGSTRQRGAALLVMLVIMVMGATTIFLGSLNGATVQIERDQKTAAALAQAKEALIGRAIRDANRPGSFPCPDMNNDGSAELLSGNQCPSYLGRLPWRTLGLADLRDGGGERLWYALSQNFRDDNSNPVNSDNRGMLTVYDNSGTTILTPAGSEAAAIVFAPGRIISSQQRDPANQNSAQNYLDIGPNNINNSIASGPFISADTTSLFNDRMILVRTRDFIPLIEKRIAYELKIAFSNYILVHPGTYPNPANMVCSSPSTCISDATQCRGWIPASAALPGWALPAWFVQNGWHRVIYYSAGTDRLYSAPPDCSPDLSVSGMPVPALFFMPGSPLGSITRPSTNPSDYLEDTENRNMNDSYVTPGSNSNDHLHTLP